MLIVPTKGNSLAEENPKHCYIPLDLQLITILLANFIAAQLGILHYACSSLLAENSVKNNTAPV